MIDAIIFDFGNVFINLDANAPLEALKKLGVTDWNEELDYLNKSYETGKIDELTFMQGIQKQLPQAELVEIREAWNSILLDFPLYRLEFLQMLTSKYKLYLLSNTDATHIEKFEHKVGQSFAREFYSCFEKVYFSFEFGFRKPEAKAFQFVLNNHNLTPKKTLFIDDKLENIKAAEELGIQTWHLQVGQEDVVDLFQKNIL
ncbi:HAD family phosphatase [Flavobacterium sp. 20NA77.7]|uniref:HAD family phosphatase n=1 Tax=Flavobacterium nakdongensis TaxID=3073563 RepID=A0ABY9R7X2_9FLAO|nr:HAD family phosphatase [Flavobacterium sp. 20NA77.7]WMW77342.1 HAD family phosphatase [Flavobacterium sp. 20NA77.7]